MGNPTRSIDPQSRDWTLVAGQRQQDPTMISSVLYLLRLVYNSSAALPGAGSKLHELDKITDDIAERIEVEVARTLRPLVDNGLIAGVTTSSTVLNDQYVSIKVRFQDSRGETQTAAFGLGF